MYAMMAALCLAALPGCGDKADSDRETIYKVAEAKPQDHLVITKATLACISRINGILDTVTDKASADAAAAELTPLCKALGELMKTAHGLGAPSAEVAAQLEPLRPACGKAAGDMLGKLGRLAPEYYGSEAMKKLVSTL